MIIGICGLIGSGKGTVADILVDQGFTKVSFANKLKDGVSTIFGWDSAYLDFGTDNLHPGPKTHKMYSEKILNRIDKLGWT